MSTYEHRLNQFAAGKRLLRLPRPVRDRADASCDACGSSLPRTLYAVKDLETLRYYFVGDNCLKQVAKRGAILRTYGRESGQKAYTTEMRLRAEDPEPAITSPRFVDLGAAALTPESTPEPAHHAARPVIETPDLIPLVLIVETPDYYRAFVAICSTWGISQSWGQAEERRHQEVWGISGDGGLVLEQVKEERLDAFGVCLTNAWEQAVAQFKGLKPTAANGPVGESFPRSLGPQLNQLLLAAKTSLQGNGVQLDQSRPSNWSTTDK